MDPSCALKVLLSVFATVHVMGFNLQIINRCAEMICPALTGVETVSKQVRQVGPSPCLDREQSVSLAVPPPWSGRVWARSKCQNGLERCQVGGCGSSDCTGKSSSNTTLVEVTVFHTNATYDISLGKPRKRSIGRAADSIIH